MTKKTIFVFLIFFLSIAGCNKTINKTINEALGSFGGRSDTTQDEGFDDDWKAVKLDKETTYFNDYLGFSYTVPKGWWLYAVNRDNFGESMGDITDDVSMDLYYKKFEDYSFSSASFIAFGNLETSEKENHLGFDLDARSLDGIHDVSGFMKYFEAFMLETKYDVEYRLADSQRITLKGKPFELRDYLVTQDDFRDYNILTLSCPVNEGYFLNIKIDYWSDNARAKNTIIESVTKAVEFY